MHRYGLPLLRILWWTTVVLYAPFVLLSGTVSPRAEVLALVAGLTLAGLGLGIAWQISLLVGLGLLVGLNGFGPFLLALTGIVLAWRWRRPFTADERTVIGRRRRWCYPVTLTATDRLLHIHVLGPTGSGKSSAVLMPMIAQDLVHGHGLTLIEPKGDLSLTARQVALAQDRTVLWVDPDDAKSPHYNPLVGPGEVAAEGLAWALEQTSTAGHPFYETLGRLELLYAVMAVKAVQPDTSDLGQVMRFLRQEGYRREVVGAVRDDRVIAYYREQIGRQSAAKAHELRIGLLNRIELLLVNPAVRNLITGPGDFTWDEVLENGYVVLCPFSLARLGKSARLLGNLFWHGLVMATYRRSVGDRSPYFLYLDEFHQYVSPDLGDFLALARGYGVGIVLAHQDFGQLSPQLRASVMANCRQRIVLGGVSGADEAVLRPDFAPTRPLNPSPRRLPRGAAWMERTVGGTVLPAIDVRLRYFPLTGGSPQ